MNRFDHLTDVYKLEKIKTIGDAYFCVGGLNDSHTECDTPHPGSYFFDFENMVL